jgi:hypothetical protein
MARKKVQPDSDGGDLAGYPVLEDVPDGDRLLVQMDPLDDALESI